MAGRIEQMEATLWSCRVHALGGDLADVREFPFGEPKDALGIVGAGDLLCHPGLVVADIGPAEYIGEHRVLEKLAGEIDGARRLIGIDDHGFPVSCDLGPTV